MAIPATPHGGSQPDAPGGSDPSMEDILASIRRILNEDEAGAPQPADNAAEPAASHAPPADDNDVLVLDQSMMVTPPEPRAADIPAAPVAAIHEPPPSPLPELIAPGPIAPEPIAPVLITEPPVIAANPSPAAHSSELLAPESEAAAVSSVGSLLRMLTAERTTQVHRGGPTIEDLVREEIRPLLKSWLDTHLPPLVERLVRTEIERVAGRAG